MATSDGKKSRGRSLTRWIIGVLVLVVLAGGARWTYWAVVLHRFDTVSEGRVYTAGGMTPEELEKVIRKNGIRSVVDFRMPGTKRGMKAETEAALLERLGVEYHRLPTGQIPADSTVDQFLEIASDSSGEPMLLHCAHGAGRSVLFGAIYRMEFEGWSNERAHRGTKRFAYYGTFAPGSEKGDFLLNYEDDPAFGPPRSAEAEEGDM